MGGAKGSGKKISIEASRRALLRDLKKKCKGESVRRNVPFINNDVPEYLKVLARLEESAQESAITVK